MNPQYRPACLAVRETAQLAAILPWANWTLPTELLFPICSLVAELKRPLAVHITVKTLYGFNVVEDMNPLVDV